MSFKYDMLKIVSNCCEESGLQIYVKKMAKKVSVKTFLLKYCVKNIRVKIVLKIRVKINVLKILCSRVFVKKMFV